MYAISSEKNEKSSCKLKMGLLNQVDYRIVTE